MDSEGGEAPEKLIENRFDESNGNTNERKDEDSVMPKAIAKTDETREPEKDQKPSCGHANRHASDHGVKDEVITVPSDGSGAKDHRYDGGAMTKSIDGFGKARDIMQDHPDEDEVMTEAGTANSRETSPTSNGNEASVSPSEYGKTKRAMSKGQINGDGGISMDKSGNSSDEDSSKRQKTDEGLDDSAVADDEPVIIPSKFHKLKPKVKKRNYRVKKGLTGETADDSSQMATDEPMAEKPVNAECSNDQSSSANADTEPHENWGGSHSGIGVGEEREAGLELNSEGGDDDIEAGGGDDSNEWTTASEDDLELEEVTPLVLQKEKPKPGWFVVPEVLNRQLGYSRLFQRRFYGSLHSVQRLELMYKLNYHQGCVNALNFNQKGNLLASGSDDLSVVIWDWPLGKKRHAFDTGHKSNVFQAKWLPLDVEHLIVTCARDGQVRLTDLKGSPGSPGWSRRIATHHGPANKLAVHPDTPHVILSVGEDAKVFSIDVRQNEPTKLLLVKEGSVDVELYSVNSNPLNCHEFCLGGRDQYVRIYDRRKISSHLHKLCPEHVKTGIRYAHVTCAVYNYNGSEVLASYNDEDIYLFDTLIPHPSGDFAHRYQGHRNSATVKGVNFFGPKSEFVVSGSDCGYIYFWDKNTESIVQWMAGDEHGVVNCLEPHPHIPVLATSGLDYDVKVWVPSCEESPSMKDLETCVKSNLKSRAQDTSREPDAFDGQMLWILWRHIRQTERNRNRGQGMARGTGDRGGHRDGEADDSSSDNETSNHSDSHSEGDNEGGPPPCHPS